MRLCIWLAVLCSKLVSSAVDAPPWAAAYIDTASETPAAILFPVAGSKLTVALPDEIRNSAVSAFGPEGQSIYVSEPGEGIVRINFNPVRQTTIRGTSGLGSIWSLTVARVSGLIFVSGMASGQCGTFEINPETSTRRVVLAGAYPLCGGGGGVVSPDGKRAVRRFRGNLLMTELGTGASHVVKGFEDKAIAGDVPWLHRVAWSPDGRWISVVDGKGSIVLIASENTDRRKLIGTSAGGAPVSWSPDSRYLLAHKSGLRCALYLYFDSLEAIDIETGSTFGIRSSHCEVGSGWAGWIDPAIAQ